MRQTLSIKNDFFPLLRLAIPFALIGVVQSAVPFFETLFLAHLDQETLAAGALVAWLFGTLASILFGTLNSVNVLISHKYGSNEHVEISRIVRDGLLLALVLVIPAFILFWNMSPILLLFHQSPLVVSLADAYLHALAWSLLPEFVMIIFLELLMGLGHSRAIVIFTILSVASNILFTYVLIFGKFGFPALGIAGAGWGTTVSYWITGMALIAYVLLQKKYKRYFKGIINLSRPKYLWELLKIGVPMGAMYCIEVAFFLTVTLLMGTIGIQALAANQIAMQYLGLVMSAIFSLAQAVTVRMGHLLGAGKIKEAEQVNFSGVYIAAALMVVIACFYWFMPLLLIAVDFDTQNPINAEVVLLGKKLLAISAVFQILEAIRISMFGALRALKDTHFTLLTSIISFWFISLPIGYLLSNYLNMDGQGYWWGMVVGACSGVWLLYWRFRMRMKEYVIPD